MNEIFHFGREFPIVEELVKKQRKPATQFDLSREGETKLALDKDKQQHYSKREKEDGRR